MLWTIIGIFIVLWILGLVAKIGGALIHLLLVAAVILFLIRLITGRKKSE
ncbi:lmo0937 family membrane protein [Siminovitchia sediminis]|uniref:Lmo0937 family membrane protein n=1 Tax=Siminovitchia sediminis TaxID=1274353 RepID=A0ABW4KM75_9BACI